MNRLTELAHDAVRAVLQAGEVAIDATAGNGHDTRFLAERVGSAGRVFAFDIQEEALASTARALGEMANVSLVLLDHALMAEAVPPEYLGRVAAIMFNLGYLPGGDKHKTTQLESTVRAIRASLELLRPGGVLSVLAYTGHPGGLAEAEAVRSLLAEKAEAEAAGKASAELSVREYRGESETESSPRLFVVHKGRPPGYHG